LVSVYWSLRGDRLRDVRRGGLAKWKEEVLRVSDRAAPFLEQLHDPEQILFASYGDIRMSSWHEEGIVFLGDAAHAMSPQLAQGRNLGVVDGVVLAECLHVHRRVPAALAAYDQRRRRHLATYQLATRWLTPFFQGDVGLLSIVRDLGFPVACAVP